MFSGVTYPINCGSRAQLSTSGGTSLLAHSDLKNADRIADTVPAVPCSFDDAFISITGSLSAAAGRI